MTETSPGRRRWPHPPPSVEPGTAEEIDWRMKSGRVARRRRDADRRRRRRRRCRGTARRSARSRCAARGSPARYHRDPAPEKFDDGWLRTGDIGTHRRPRLHPDHRPRQGRHQVRRRVDLLGRAGEPARWPTRRARGGVIGVPDEQVDRAAAGLRRAARRARRPRPTSWREFLDGKVAAWQCPENWTFVDEVPKTSVGKFDKKVLRARHAHGELGHRPRPRRRARRLIRRSDDGLEPAGG